MASTTATRVLAPVGTAGKLFAFGLDVGRGLFRRPFQTREFIQQAWFIASVTIIPTALVAIPFGAVIALQVGGLIKQFGAQSFTGSAAVLAVVQQAGPIATALLIAGAGGSAIAADLGARKIREELDAMMVLGIDPIQRLVVPRVLGCRMVAVFLAAYKGMSAGGGPKGVGDAVNESVVITFVLLFIVNFTLSAIYLQIVPPKTG